MPPSAPLPSEQPTGPALLHWYDRHRRTLPWRHLPGEAPDPYRVWLSEIMLQQTTVTAVIPYFERFLARFPTVAALAAAPEEAVLSAWAGLGYYARARNMHACARQVRALGGFPRTVEGLRSLPGIGAYTAAAVAAIAFGVPVVPVDGNVERVTARLFAITESLPGARPAIAAAAARLGDDAAARLRPSDFAQALFDLGATLCSPVAPACALCPLTRGCAGRIAGIAAELPRKAPKAARPTRFGAHFWLTDAAGQVLLRRRPPRGLLGGMTELPGTAWTATRLTRVAALTHAPMPAVWRSAGRALHGFTHFQLEIDLYAAEVPVIEADGFLRPADALADEALPSVMRKCIAAVLAA
jgi:A/G-specific adenine glycosylase